MIGAEAIYFDHLEARVMRCQHETVSRPNIPVVLTLFNLPSLYLLMLKHSLNQKIYRLFVPGKKHRSKKCSNRQLFYYFNN